jgi:hypothetical protein
LVSVLASPFVGVSNDALLLIRRNARGPIFTGLERALPAGSRPRRHAASWRAFRQRYDRLAEAAPRLSLERPLRADRRRPRLRPRRARAVGRPPALRELRKLARLARSYEELRGPTSRLRRFVEEQEAVGEQPERGRGRGGGGATPSGC